MSLFRICGLLVGSGLSARHPFLVKSVAWQAIIVKKPVANVAASVIRSVRDSWQSNKVIGHLFKSGRIKGVFGTFSFGLLGIQLSSPSHEKHKKNRLVGLDPGIELVEDTSFWRQLLAYLLPHWFGLLVAVTCAMAVAVLNIEIPQMLGSIVNVVATYAKNEGAGEESFMQDIKGPAMKMVKLYLAQSIMTFGYIYSLSCVGERVAAQMRQDLFSSVICQDIAFFDNHKCGEIVSRLTSDVQDFKSSFKLCISQGLRSLTQTVGCGVALYSISPQMTGIMLLVVPTVIITGTGLGSLLRSLSKKAQSQIAKATAVGEECISNIRTVRAFAMEATEEELYNREVDKSRSINELLGLGIGVFQAGSNLFLNGIVLTTLYCGGYLLSSNRLSPGELMSFLVATQTIQRSLAQMSLMFGQFIKGMAAGSRVFEYINLIPSIPIAGGKIIPYHSLVGDIEFTNVTFRYPTRPEQAVLKNFSLRIPAGQMVALVGSSGGGKSTVAALLERFYECGEGTIKVDGVDVKDLDPKWLRGRAIGYINQEPVLFATSVMENIRYGRPDATDQEVIEASKSAHAHEFITDFPEGYGTVLGERGVTVSGGQKQRIAIARALLKNPSVLILDEATSALDAESEKIVQEALDGVAKGRTVLVIAHRLSTIQNANLIAVMTNGSIAEMGTHDSLKKKRGLYYNLIRQQEQEKELEMIQQSM